jgi:hypothetical protein
LRLTAPANLSDAVYHLRELLEDANEMLGKGALDSAENACECAEHELIKLHHIAHELGVI